MHDMLPKLLIAFCLDPKVTLIEEYRLLGFQSGRWVPTFRKSLFPAFSTVKREAAGSFETLVLNYSTTRRHTPEYFYHCLDNLKLSSFYLLLSVDVRLGLSTLREEHRLKSLEIGR
jgi:hypothetical protein